MQAYIITNTATNMEYVGITTKSLESRWKEHIKGSRRTKGGCTAIGCAIVMYGSDAFTIEAVGCSKSIDDLKDMEVLLIAQRQTLFPHGYNLTSGGFGGFNPAAVTRERIAASKRGVPRSEECRRKLAIFRTGLAASNETRARMAESHIEAWANPTTRKNHTAGRKSRVAKMTAEERLAMVSKALVPWTPERRAKLAAAVRARYAQPGQREAASQLAKEQWQRPDVQEKHTMAWRKRRQATVA